MKYAIIPSAAFVFLTMHYKVMNQIWKEGNLLPFMMLEDYFSDEQITEIELQGGIVFESTINYFEWLDSQN